MLSATPYGSEYKVIDANVALHQLDLLETPECAVIQDCIIPQTAAEEVRGRNLAAYSRLMALVADEARRVVLFPDQHHRETALKRLPLETPNDFNDRVIRGVALFYQRTLDRAAGVTHSGASSSASSAAPGVVPTSTKARARVQVRLLSDDADNRRRAKIDGLLASSCREFASMHDTKFPGLSEKVALGMEAAKAQSNAPSGKKLHKEHLTASQLAGALRSGRVFRGTLRVSKDCWFEARVAIRVPRGSVVALAAAEAAALADGSGPMAASSTPGAVLVATGQDETEEMREDTAAQIRQAELDAAGTAATASSTSPASSSSAAAPPSSSAAAVSAASASTGGRAGEAEEVVSILVRVGTAINRATEGDVVAVRVLPPSQWEQPWARLAPAKETAVEAEAEAEAAEGADGHQQGAGRKERGFGIRAGCVPTGAVVSVIRRAWRPLCGSIEDEATTAGGGGDSATRIARGGAKRAMFVPVDGRWPRVRLETRQAAALAGQRIIIALDSWPAGSKYPLGHYVRTLGPIGDREAETAALLEEHDIPTGRFSSAVMACLPPANWIVTPATATANGRRDLRSVCVCSIDPPGCKDIDDALHFRSLGPDPGRPGAELFEAGVHIADVTHFVRPNTPIDEEGARRGNTTYLVERRLDMLPGLLTTSLCSLRGGVDRFAFSVTWRIRRTPPAASSSSSVASAGAAYEVLGSDFFRSTIHSRAAMTYGEAQALLDDPTDTGEVALAVKGLAGFTRFLKAGRIKDGALTLASPEVRFQLDSETHEPLDVRAYEHKETNSLVEEMMLLANVTVARRITDAFPRYAVLRRHPEPPRRNFDQLIAAAKVVGVEIDVESSRALQISLDRAEAEAERRRAAGSADDALASSPHFSKTLRILATRCMLQAAYFPSGECAPEQYRHYGLASPIYTHFTSPIRRYADVMVHRLLAAAIGLEPLPAACEDLQRTRELTDNLNRRHVNAQHAGRASVALHTVVFFGGRAVLAEAIVLRVRSNGAAVLVPRFGIEGPAIVAGKSAPRAQRGDHEAVPGPWDEAQCEVQDGGMTLRCPKEAAPGGWAEALGKAGAEDLRLRVFDSVTVCLRVKEGARHRRALEIVLVDPPFFPTPTAATHWSEAPTAEAAKLQGKRDAGRPAKKAATSAQAKRARSAR